ncbi:MAG: alkaline phosphatase, partial [Cyanobacteria bacterium J06636_27]
LRSTPPEKLLGVFAADDTFDDQTEEELGLNTDTPLPLYVETAPTVAEMLDASLKIIEDDPDGFFAVVEEEGTDNFSNNNNAVGTIEAMSRADAAIGSAIDYIDNQDPNTLLVTAADSDGGGLEVFQYKPYDRPEGNFDEDNPELSSQPEVPFITVNPTTERDDVNYLDGVDGSTASEENPWVPFSAKDSLDGEMGDFGIGWVGTPDVPGSIVAKTYGLNADKLASTVDNTGIYDIMYETLFGMTPEEAASNQTEPNSETNLVSGTPERDILIPGIDGFSGQGSSVFAGAGNDEIDLAFGGNNNRVDAGSGDDVVYLNSQNRALGGEGDDKFFASGGGNTISGGAGSDQFWIVSEEIPEVANTIVDFEAGTDVIGILGSESLGISSSTLELTEMEGDTKIAFDGNTLAMINGVTGLDVSQSIVFA